VLSRSVKDADQADRQGNRKIVEVGFVLANEPPRSRQYQLLLTVVTTLFAVFAVVLTPPFCFPAIATSPPRILIINAWDDTMPAAVRATTAIRNRLAESPLNNAEIYYDTLDFSRFPD